MMRLRMHGFLADKGLHIRFQLFIPDLRQYLVVQAAEPEFARG